MLQQLAPDVLVHICSRFDSVAPACALTCASKFMKRFFSSEAVWNGVVRNVCGYDVIDGPQPLLYRVMITCAPYLAAPEHFRLTEGDIKAFEVAKRKDDGALLLWIVKGDFSYHIQLTGDNLPITADGVVFLDKPATLDVGLDALTHWAGIHPRLGINTVNFPFHHDLTHSAMRIHKSVFVSCIHSTAVNARIATRTLVFFKQTGALTRVLYSTPTCVGKVPGSDPPLFSAFVSFDRARLCIMTGSSRVSCYGPRSVYDWAPDPAVVLRRIIGEGGAAVSPTAFDRVTGLTVAQCVAGAHDESLE